MGDVTQPIALVQVCRQGGGNKDDKSFGLPTPMVYRVKAYHMENGTQRVGKGYTDE